MGDIKDKEEYNETMSDMRVYSREEFLRRGGGKVTEREEKEHQRNKELLRMAKEKLSITDVVDRYAMPVGYETVDDEGKIVAVKKADEEELLKGRYVEEVWDKSDQERLSDLLEAKARNKFG